jgi:hypothetical protein
MARKKQPDLSNIFAKTEPGEAPGDHSDLDAGNIRSTGVGLRAGEIAALDAIGEPLGLARNALIRFAVRRFLIEYRAGKVDLGQFIEEPPPPKKSLRMPD